jgi:RNA polymerase sigma factor (sigma-70 family)
MENPFNDSKYKDDADLALISTALNGDKIALNNLLKRHQDYIFNVAMKMLNNIADAEDVTQEILIKIVTQLSKYDSEKARFRTWLYRITFNHILNRKKNQYEMVVTDFNVFFSAIDDAPDIPILQEEEKSYNILIDESKISCMAGMIMCLDREQRLTYIIGDIFEINHNLASEIFEISPDNFRQKLSRARKDLYQWMHNRCGLVNEENSCRCRNKTKAFINAGYVDPKNLKWLSNYKNQIFELSERVVDEAWNERDKIYQKLFLEHPFKNSLKSNQVYEAILGNKEFSSIMKLN